MSGTMTPTDTTGKTTGAATSGAITTGSAGTIPTGGPKLLFIQYQTFTSNTS